MSKISPVKTDPETGRKTWDSQPGDTYEVTGTTTDGKKFKQFYTSWMQANGINLWKGSVWLRRGTQRYLVKRVVN